MAINLSRNTRLFVSTVESGWTNANTFEIPIQEGYTLSQAVTTSDVGVNEAGPAPVRGSKRFNDALDPVEWAFSTYITPYLHATHSKVYVVDALLWQGLAVKRGGALDFENNTNKLHGDATKFVVDFADNNAHVLTPLFFYFKIDNTWYKVSNAQVGSAEISVDISDIAMVNWGGQATKYETLAGAPAFFSTSGEYDSDGLINGYVAIPANKKYIVNKLTTMTLEADVAPGTDPALDNYNIPITGASVSINNNITYLTPNTLAEVDQPIGSFTGGFDVTGSLQAYLKTSTAATGAVGAEYSAADLLTHMLSNESLGSVTNSANLVMTIGGTAAGDAKCILTIPTAHLSVPEVSVEDVVSTSIEFKGITSSQDLLSGTEIGIEFKAA